MLDHIRNKSPQKVNQIVQMMPTAVGSSINISHFGDSLWDLFSENGDILSFSTRHLFEVVNYVFICCFIGVFGITTNSINMVVFCKQGFKNTMTISFMALAISDMSCLITLQWFVICMNPLTLSSKNSLLTSEIHSITGGWPHVTFGRITSCVTTYITAERCLCITAPLAVRNILTPKRTTCSLVVIYVVNIIVLVPEYTTSYVGWKFYPERNRSLLGVILSSDNEKAEGIVFLLHAILVLTSFLCVVVLTSVLVIKLKIASKWRRQATQGKDQSEAMSTKDKKATSMVAMISSLLIVTNSPGIILSLVSFCEPKFGIFGVYQNLFFAIWSFGFIFNAINSSVNIFMYYNMSSKYREIFDQIFLKERLT